MLCCGPSGFAPMVYQHLYARRATLAGHGSGDNTPRFRLLWKMSLPLGGFIKLTGITKGSPP